MGYNTIADVIHGHIASGDVVRLSVGKSVALWAALGSGTSGGLLAPMLLIGAGVGSIFGSIVHTITPGASFNGHVAAIVAMSALFGAAARAPFTAFVFAFELTGDTQAIIPLMIAGATADVSCRFFLKQSIMTERLARRGLHVPQDYEADPLRQIPVGRAMSAAVDTVPCSMTIRDLIAHIDRHDAGFRRQGFPVVDEQGRLHGVVTRSDVAAVTAAPESAEVTLDDPVSAIASTDLALTYVDVALADALLLMVRRKIGRLPVVARGDERKLVGWLSRSDIFRAREQSIEAELVRERPLAPAHFLAAWPRFAARHGTNGNLTPSPARPRAGAIQRAEHPASRQDP
jgi:CBS domain-containing protein